MFWPRSPLLALLLSLLFLLLREGIDHEELAVGRIPLLLEQFSGLALREILVLFRHEDGTFKRFHSRDVDVVLILLITLQVWLSQVVTN